MVDGIAFVDARVGGVVASMRIYCNEEQPSNALLLMLVTPAGRDISVRDEQPLKSSSLMLVSCVFSRFTTLVRDLQERKAYCPMLVSVSGKVISAREEQP